MKALIVSDSHGATTELIALQKRHADADLFLHCGDSELAADSLALTSYEVVRGNCDYEKSFPNEIVQTMGSHNIFITHGHLYNIKMTLQTIVYKAKEVGAHIACFGHSHRMGAEYVDGVLLINPGSIVLPRGRKEKTYALLEIKTNEATVTFYEINGQVVAKESFLME